MIDIKVGLVMKLVQQTTPETSSCTTSSCLVLCVYTCLICSSPVAYLPGCFLFFFFWFVCLFLLPRCSRRNVPAN